MQALECALAANSRKRIAYLHKRESVCALLAQNRGGAARVVPFIVHLLSHGDLFKLRVERSNRSHMRKQKTSPNLSLRLHISSKMKVLREWQRLDKAALKIGRP